MHVNRFSGDRSIARADAARARPARAKVIDE
jgi:hypothetical protein